MSIFLGKLVYEAIDMRITATWQLDDHQGGRETGLRLGQVTGGFVHTSKGLTSQHILIILFTI